MDFRLSDEQEMFRKKWFPTGPVRDPFCSPHVLNPQG